MSAVLHRNLVNPPPMIERGDGPYLIDGAGKRYLDASGGAAVSCLGHSHAKVIARLHEQLDRLAYAHTSFFTSSPAEDLANHLIERAPDGFGAGRVAFVGSGSEAMEVALKLARQYYIERGEPERTRFIARNMAYHGNTLGSLSVGGHTQRRALYEPMLFDVGRVAACYPYRQRAETETDEQYGARLVDELDAEIQRIGPHMVAAFVVEPVAGAVLGCVPPIPGYFPAIRALCDKYGILLIADEVMCGMGRTGSLFALDQENTVADIITIAKGLGAGYQPIAAVMAAEKVVQAIVRGSGILANGHTYMSHAIACAGALAVLETIEQDNLIANVEIQGAALRNTLEARFGQHPNVGDIRGRGLFQALELVVDRDTKQPFPADNNLAARIKQCARDNGLICYPSAGCADGINGDNVLLAPPYIIAQGHIDEIADKLEDTLKTCLAA